MKAGRLRDRVTLKHASRSTNAIGEVKTSWVVTVANLPAEVDENPGQQTFEQSAFTASKPILVKIRYRGDVLAQHTLTWDGDDYRILSCYDPTGRRAELFLVCARDE